MIEPKTTQALEQSFKKQTAEDYDGSDAQSFMAETVSIQTSNARTTRSPQFHIRSIQLKNQLQFYNDPDDSP
ncbi:hypothetical protein CEXT_173151 [Caerostris extrusa]|uniref:Uncharacterized protein n=1 Tax=Caerostris extrusa TaxID=172846 RepID=A0AAV4P4D7_CAEEX|nr:hypothetical protein CEXT_173151 [Caerostris extrusa]